ncbi:hypothetical protein WKW79_09470 [Variovorax robiniae]|uniref:Uncharacterized protein n=1 Tax=Variovorax robiniae TaxID=1836199 RepID=A0ABU8X6T1_9BURK
MKALHCLTLAAGAALLPCLAHAFDAAEPLNMVYMAPVAAPTTQRPNGPPVADTTAQLARNCALFLGPIEDLRSNPGTVGALMFGIHAPMVVESIRSGDVVKWTHQALESTRAMGFQPQDGAAPTADTSNQVGASFGLRLAHAWSAGLNLVSHVVLQASFQTPDGPVTRRYHGMGTIGNWNNGNGEYMTVLNAAMANAVQSFATDAGKLCTDRRAFAPAAAQPVASTN